MFTQQNLNTLLSLRNTFMDLIGKGSKSDDSGEKSSDSGDKAERAHRSGKGQTDEHLFQQACYEAIIELSKNEDLAPLFPSQDKKERLEEAQKMVRLVEDVIAEDLNPKERHLVVLTIGLREKSVTKEIPQEKKDGKKDAPKPIKRTSTANDSGRDIIIRLALEQNRDEIAKRCKLMSASEGYKESQWKKWDATAAEVVNSMNSGLDSVIKKRKPLPFWISFIPFFNFHIRNKYDRRINPHLYEDN